MAAILRVKDENGNIVSIPAIKGDKGEKGEKGDRGLPGSGGVPDGGTAGQILTKNSGEDGDAGWKDAVQADWNESDESSSAFVKNRTHYTEYENQLQFDYNEDRNFYTITSSAALDTDKTYELVFDYDIGNDAGGQADALIRRGVINPVTYKGSWVGKFTQKTKYGSTFWCFNDIHPADNSFLPCIYSSDMKMFTGYINGCVNNEAWLNEVKIAVPLDLKYIPETIARASDTVMGTGEEQHFGSAVEEQICSNIGALYLGDLSNYLSDKVDKNQGTENSGKFLGIGADGIVIPTDSPATAFSDDGSGNISVNGASSDAKRFLNSLTVPGLDYKYVNPINSGTYASPYGVYITSGTVIDYVVGLTQVGFYTAYVNRKVTDIPDAAKAANSSLRGFVCVSQIDNTASGGSTKCYAYIVLIDQNSNFYIQYIQSSTGGGWKRMYPYETAESALMEKLDKNQGTANSGKFLGIGADGVVVPTEVGGGGESSEWKKIRDISVTSEAGVVEVSITEDSEGNSLSLNEAFILIKSETKQYAYAPITIRNGNSYVSVGEYRLANEAENAPGVIRIRPFGLYWMASYMKGGYQQNVVDYNWGFYYQKSQPRLSEIPKITGIRIGFSTIEAEVWGR